MEEVLEIQGNNGGNCIKIGKFKEGDNRIFLEIVDCCVVIFRGILTVEMLSNFLASISTYQNKDLITLIKENMSWDKDVNEKFSECAKHLSWKDMIKDEII